MTWRIQFTGRAERDFGDLPRPLRRRFGDAISRMGENPCQARPGLDVKRLEGAPRTYRLRVGQYRAVFEAQDGVVLFTRFGPRSSVYRP